MVQDLTSEYFKVPNDIHLIVNNVYEYSILLYLLRFANGNNKHPTISLTGLRMNGLMSRQKAITTIQSLESKGYVSHTKRNYQSNEYSIYMDKILRDIRLAQSGKTIEDKAAKEYNDQQKDMMALRRINRNKDLLIKANSVNGIKAIDEKTGEILN